MIARFVIPVLLLTCVFAGERVYRSATSSNLSPQDAANDVGAVYGDLHPLVLRYVSSQTDGPSDEPMYEITITGNFRNGSRTAHYLTFLAMADRHSACCLWAGNTLPGRTAHRAWSVQQVPALASA